MLSHRGSKRYIPKPVIALLLGGSALIAAGAAFSIVVSGRNDAAVTIPDREAPAPHRDAPNTAVVVYDDGPPAFADHDRVWVREAAVTVPRGWHPAPTDAFMVARPRTMPVSFSGAPNYAAPIRSAMQSLMAVGLAQQERNLQFALLDFARNFPSGKEVEVKVVTRGTSVIGVTDTPDGMWMKPGDRQHAYTVYGTNIEMARDEGYDCFETGSHTFCVPPRQDPHEEDYIQDAIDNGGTVEAFTDAARRASKDVTDATRRLVRDARRTSGSQPQDGDAGGVSIGNESSNRGSVENAPSTDGSANADRDPGESARSIDTKYYRRVLDASALVIGLGDRQFGRQVAAVGTAALDVHDAVQKFAIDSAAASGWVDGALAAVTLGSSLAAVGPLLAAAFVDAGPSADQLILDQLHQLRSQVEDLRSEMHDRFDGVHAHLDQVFATMIDAFDVLRDGDRRALESVLGRLEDTRRHITEIGRVQLDTQQIAVQHYEMLRDLIVNLELAGCDRRHSVADDDPMTISKWRDCRALIEALHRTLPDQQLSPPEALTTQAYWLEERPDVTLSWSLQEFRRLLAATGPEGATRAAALPELVVGPEAWYAIMDVHDDFLRRYPEYAEMDARDMRTSGFSASMRRWRADLVRYAEAIRDEVRVFQAGSRPTVFSMLLAEARVRGRMTALLLGAVGNPFELMWECLDGGVTKRADCDALDRLNSPEEVRDRLVGLDELKRMELDLAIADAHLKAWTTLAFRDRIRRSSSITSLASGWLGLRDLRERIDASGLLAFPAWPRLAAGLDGNVESIAELLRSDDVRQALSLGFEHSILTTAGFRALGDLETQ